MPDEVRGLWIGDRLGTFQRLCVQSFLDHGHAFRLFTYGHIEGVPDGAIVEDGSSVLAPGLLQPFLDGKGALAHFADWFRWELLRQRGGYWVDMDVICIRPFDFEAPVVYGCQDPFTPSVGVLRFPAGHPMTETMVDRCANPHRMRDGDSLRRRARKALRRLRGGSRGDVLWGEAGGPTGFREALEGSDCQQFGLPYPVFYPVHHQHWPCIFDETLKDQLPLFESTRAIHLWHEVFRVFSGLDPEGPFHPDSIYEQLKRKHLG
jgi:hypothetical protein